MFCIIGTATERGVFDCNGWILVTFRMATVRGPPKEKNTVDLFRRALVAPWVKCWLTDVVVPGSSPA